MLWSDGYVFLEAPRWHQGRLWVSDVFDHKVYAIDPDGQRTKLCDIPGRPSGLGFMPDGSAVIAAMNDLKLLRLVDGKLETHADLSGWAVGCVNDFAIDRQGRIYVGNFGYDHNAGEAIRPADLHLVDVDGSVRVVAQGLEFPNGAVIADQGQTLIVAETWKGHLTAFNIDPENGGLFNRRTFADLGTRQPDGICLDAEGALWVAAFNTGDFLRVLEGGRITDRVALPGRAIACALGGVDGRTLFCCDYYGGEDDRKARRPLCGVFTAKVDVPAAP
jgi:sugar lactone lactonase YvrE